MVKNEEDVIGPVIEHLLAEGIHHVIVADNLSSDGTREILEALAQRCPVTVVNDPDPAHRQSEKMTHLFHMARERGASWVIPFDADEVWVSPEGRLADVIEGSADADMLVALMFDHYPLLRGESPFSRMRLRDRHPTGFQKVAIRAMPGVVIAHGNHMATGPVFRRIDGRLAIHHYSYRSFGHFVRKNRQGKNALDATNEADETLGAHWRKYGGYSEARLAYVWGARYLRAVLRGVVVDDFTPSWVE